MELHPEALCCCPLLALVAHGSFASAQKSDLKPAETPAPPQAPSTPPAPNTLLDGTAIKLRLAETMSSAHAKAEQSVAFEVVEEVDVQGVVVIPKGAQALATVTGADIEVDGALKIVRESGLKPGPILESRTRREADPSASLRDDN